MRKHEIMTPGHSPVASTHFIIGGNLTDVEVVDVVVVWLAVHPSLGLCHAAALQVLSPVWQFNGIIFFALYVYGRDSSVSKATVFESMYIWFESWLIPTLFLSFFLLSTAPLISKKGCFV